jgi:heme/copper-type cytochrome/quinol oxidase subunit 3
MTPSRIVGDVSDLPDYAFGPRSIMWWGLMGFMLIEGTAFVLAVGAYFFLVGHANPFPPDHPPRLIWGALFTLALVLTEIPNVWANRVARQQDERKTKLALIVMTLVALPLFVLRALEFTALNTRWDSNAYGSIVWALIVLHTTHLLTDWGDTVALAIFSHTHGMDGGRFADVSDNALYWHFVVVSWVAIAAVIYLAPRLL